MLEADTLFKMVPPDSSHGCLALWVGHLLEQRDLWDQRTHRLACLKNKRTVKGFQCPAYSSVTCSKHRKIECFPIICFKSRVSLTLVRSTPVRALTETGSSASRRFTSPVRRLPSPLRMTISLVLARGAATLPAIYKEEKERKLHIFQPSKNLYLRTLGFSCSIMSQNIGSRVVCLSTSDQREH